MKMVYSIVLQGSHIWSKLRPVDQLRQLLIDCQGPDAEEVKAFFLRLHKVCYLRQNKTYFLACSNFACPDPVLFGQRVCSNAHVQI